MKFDKVIKNEYGFYELKQKPSEEEQKRIFENEYYQEGQSSYEVTYPDDAIKYFMNKAEQKEIAIRRIIGSSKEKLKILDIGCGEGFLLKHFWLKGYDILGIDYSEYAMRHNNPELLPRFRQGDCYEVLRSLISQEEKFDIVNMDAVLDMVQRPAELIELIKQVLKEDGVMSCKVANNYSDLQIKLLEEQVLTQEYWLDEQGHSWYFNKDGFINFFKAHGYTCVDLYGEGLSEFNLLNDLTNYYENPKAGKSCWKAKLRIENMLHELSAEKTNEIMRLFGQMGLGRELVGIFKMN